MRLNEFTDPRNYTLSTDDMAAIINQIGAVWCHYEIDPDGPMLRRIMGESEDKNCELIDLSAM
jgi:hypothetical protein